MGEPNINNYIIKITLYKGYHPDEVVYYRYDFPPMLLSRWRWYFEYIAALVKVKHPHEKVELYINQNKEGFRAGELYIEKKRNSLLSHKKGQLRKLEGERVKDDDLFGTKEAMRMEKIERVRREINELESGQVNFWYPPTYKNIIKRYI